jgi:hypothetical protein
MVRAATINPQPIDRTFLSGAPKAQADALHRHLDTVRASRERQPLGTIAATVSIGSRGTSQQITAGSRSGIKTLPRRRRRPGRPRSAPLLAEQSSRHDPRAPYRRGATAPGRFAGSECSVTRDPLCRCTSIPGMTPASLPYAELETELTRVLADFLQALRSKPEPAPSTSRL